MILFSILIALWITKINAYLAYVRFRIKQKLGVKRAKPLDCTACMSFWIMLTFCYLYSMTWDMYIINCITAYAGGSFIEKVWYKL